MVVIREYAEQVANIEYSKRRQKQRVDAIDDRLRNGDSRDERAA